MENNNIKTKILLVLQQLLIAFFVIMLVGCGSLPLISPDMTMKPKHPVRLGGAYGILTAQQSKTILSKLKKNSDDTNIFDKHLAVEMEIVGSPLVIGNKVTLLVDGIATYEAMFAAIENAKNHINIETYIIDDDEIGQRFVELLVRKQRSGVQVNFIYDSVGAFNTPKSFFQPLIESGVNVLEFNPINPLLTRKGWEVNLRDHRKLLIVDGQIAFVGGINISSVYSSSSFGRFKAAKNKLPWRDTHVRIEGPVVTEFQKLFMTTWLAQKGDVLADKRYFPQLASISTEVVRAIGSSPDELYSQMYATLISAINSAETQICLTNAYFVPDVQLLAALKEAVLRGVDVKLLLPDKSDSMLVFYASRSYYDELLKANIKIYERKNALLHAKTVLIDGVWSTIGSTNLDWRSFLNNQEINAVILGQGFGTQMQTLFEKDLQSSELITRKVWRKRSISTRLKEQAARLWARLL
ncbi:cardiolipin synthase [Moraxellaceae bacterium AER2_44_116]|nr:cardiolipin synthase [Moraxellaceae bacterium]TQC96855.1 cardiolipin synthase [Moraxellaceae bacterium AER2_44_116]